VRQIFRELRKVRQKGAGAFNYSATRVVGQSWLYVLQTHLKMVEFMSTEFRRHPAIMHVFTSHLDRFRITKSSHNALKASHKVIKSQVGVLDDSVKRLQGSRGNRGGSERGDMTPP
jgi:hypothetical protein